LQDFLRVLPKMYAHSFTQLPNGYLFSSWDALKMDPQIHLSLNARNTDYGKYGTSLRDI
jgi:hypothetical protein